MCFNVHLYLTSQVVENVRVFITDANDEKPEFLNLPLVVDVPEVRRRRGLDMKRSESS